MRLPRRKYRDIPSQQVPGLFASFGQPKSPSTQSSTSTSPRQIEDGIELVPIERQVSSCAKFLVPGQEEKEVVLGTQPKDELSAKPLPSLPKSRWNRMPIKHRMLVILCIQISTVLTIGLSLLSIKSRVDRRFEDDRATQSPQKMPIIPTPPSTVRGGTFQLFMNSTQEESSSCLAAANETGAWTCYPQRFQIALFPSTEESSQPFLLLKSLGVPGLIRYGPDKALRTNVTVNTTLDPDHLDYGWAYYFQSTYDRTVLIRETQMNQEEDITTGPMDVLTGDRSWRCLFPDVTIDGYIYVTRNTTAVNSTTVTSEEESLEYLPYAMRYSERYTAQTRPAQCSRMIMREDGVLAPTSDVMNLTLAETMAMSRETHYSDSGKEPGRKRQQPKITNSCRCQWMIQ